MPTKTFLNLPQEKQNLLLKIAKEEFSSNLFNDVSINKIIKKANIARGSFYAYFKDKEDLYHYLLLTIKETVVTMIEEKIKTSTDLNEAFLNILENFLNNCGENNLFMQKVFLNSNFNNQMFPKETHHNKGQFLENMVQYVDITKFKNKDAKSILNLYFIVMTNNMIMFIKEKKSKEEIIKDFKEQLNIIAYGYKEEK